MALSGTAASWYSWLKVAVFALLVSNTAAYAVSGTFSEALDSFAWLLLLAAFELEAGIGGIVAMGPGRAALRIVRLVAAAAILVAGIGYVRGGEWLDAVNTGLWIGVVALLEAEVRYPGAALRYRRWFAGAATTLYSGLAMPVLIWAWRGDWFDAYDAALWLTAFAALELGWLQKLRRGHGAGAPLQAPGG